MRVTLHYWQSNDLAEDYRDILKHVVVHGAEVAPRGKPTRELLSFTLELTDPTRAWAAGTERKLSVALAGAEALQLVGGFSDPGAMLQISQHFREFTDGGVFHAPYGPRIASQLPAAIEWLKIDPDTRKAHVSVWDPVQDLWTQGTRDHPCTTHMQFMIRNDALDLHVGMRANDAWRGFPNDVFQFTQLQQAIAACLHIDLGTYYHHATSFHLYEENLNDVDRLISSSQPPFYGVGIDYYFATWSAYQQRARDVFYGGLERDQMNEGELRMWEALRKHGVEGKW
jgi:thymidylate synthase